MDVQREFGSVFQTDARGFQESEAVSAGTLHNRELHVDMRCKQILPQ
jgi:hypothetical protein